MKTIAVTSFPAVICTLICLTNCKKDVYEKSIGSNILISVSEVNGVYFLNAETVKQYPCSSYPIEYSKRRLGSAITIKFKYIPEVDGCFPVIGPAMATIDLGKLEKDSYTIRFRHKGKTTQGTLLTNPPQLKIANEGNVKMKQ